MCRLFGQLCPTPAGGRGFLLDSEFSLLKQSDFKKSNPQADGWGIGYFKEGKPLVTKSAGAAFKEKESFQKAAAAARSTAVIGHLRAASNPRGLPKPRLINVESSQPYTDGEWIFAHNGTLQIPDEVTAALGPLKKNVRSLNDSEVYFWQFLKYLRQTNDPAEAFALCVAEDWDLWKKCRRAHADKDAPYTTLNTLATDGKSLHVFCHSILKRPGEALCSPGQAWTTMSRALREGKFIAASEDMDRLDWTRFDPPEVVAASIENSKLKISRRQFSLTGGRIIPRSNPKEEAIWS